MSSNPPPPPDRSWKHDVGGKESRRPAGPLWRRQEEAVRTRRYWSRKQKIGLAVLALLIFTGLLIWAALWLVLPRPTVLVLVGAGYEDNLAIPHNVYGHEGLKGLAELAQMGQPRSFWDRGLVRLKHEPRVLRQDVAWDQGLDSFKEKTVVVFLALHGGVDHQGAYLLLDGDPRDERNRLRLNQVLDRLAQLPESKNKVLVLDATQMTAHWLLGMMHNDFARELEKLDARIQQIPNLVVLSSSDADQRSWVSEEWRRTIFTHHVTEGLKGAADSNSDGRVNAMELHRYVRQSVEGWVQANREALQTPVLLPKGEAGEKRAGKIELTVVRGYQPPDAHTRPAFEPPPQLAKAWEQHRNLAQQPRYPATYTPQLWRRYQDMLLRYDQLVRAGELEVAAKFNTWLGQVEQEMLRAQRLELSSVQNSLTMHALAGPAMSPPPQIERQFNELWDAPPAEVAKVWKQLQGSAGGDRPNLQHLRLKVYELLLERVAGAKDVPAALDRAHQLIQALDDPLLPRPAEMHFLAMLQRDRPRTPPPPDDYFETVQLGVRVRRAAERTVAAPTDTPAYSEQVLPWVQKQLEDADKLRRLGEDLLLAADAESWKKARGLLEKADDIYQKAQATASVVRQGLAVRDQVLAELPYYSEWLARRRVADSAQPEQTTFLQEIEDLWKQTHQLVRLLESGDAEHIHKPPPAGTAGMDEPQPRSLTDQAELVSRGFRNVEQRFTEYWQRIDPVDLPSLLRDAEDALLVPHRDPALRMKLINNQRGTSRRLLLKTEKPGPSEKPGFSREKNEEEAKSEARRQARMALAVLGKRWFDETSSADREDYAQLQGRLTVEEQWWDALTKLGSQIGQRWRSLPDEIDRLSQERARAERQRPGEKPGSTPDPSRPLLQRAARLTRLLESTAKLAVSENPVDDYRRALARELLIVQAQRALDDHWFAEDANAPYYRVSGLMYVDDARRIGKTATPRGATPAVAAEAARSTREDELEAKLRRPGGLVLKGPAQLHLTSERRLGITYQLQPASSGVEGGFPVVWLEAGKSLETVYPAAQTRLVREVGADPTAGVVTCAVSSPVLAKAEKEPPAVPKPEETSVRLQAIFRGQRIQLETRVDLHPVPDIVVSRRPLPLAGNLAVRADRSIHDQFGASQGAIVIVLDCSGSMDEVLPGGTTRFKEAIRALDEDVLSQIPKGTTVSLWVFSQREADAVRAEDVEKSIRPLVRKVVWEPDNPTQRQELMQKVRALTPWNVTPIVRAMMEARVDLEGVRGFKTLVVLTDGMDNRFERGTYGKVTSSGDPKYNPDGKLRIAAFLDEAFKDSDIAVHLLGFRLPEEERQRFIDQFKKPIEAMPGGSKCHDIRDTAELIAALQAALRQKLRYWVEREDKQRLPGVPESGLDISQIGGNDRWIPKGLSAGPYNVWVYANKRADKSVLLSGGDLLLVNLVSTPRGLEFERVLYSKEDFSLPNERFQERPDWRLAVLQNQLLNERRLQMLVTMEKLTGRRDATLRQIRPREIWFELATRDERTTPKEPEATDGSPFASRPPPFALRWSDATGYPAPAWTLDVSQWPVNPATQLVNRPVLSVWWNPEQDATAPGTLERGVHFKTLADLQQREQPVRVEGEPVVIESVTVEEHLVETKPRLLEMKSCLVVRARHEKGKPIRVRAAGLNPTGQEHRYYLDVGKYTALFWTVEEREAEERLQSLSVFSIAAFKKDAEQKEFKMELRELRAPQPGDTRPTPPAELE